MGKMRKFTTRLLSVTLAAVVSLFAVGGSALATVINYEWAVGWFGKGQENLAGWTGNGSTKFSVDDKVHTDNSWYSIKIENTDYNLSYVERTYDVEPYTTYRFSAMVKYSGYALSPNVKAQKSGACVGKAYSYDNSGFTTSSDWTFMEYEFTTGNETTYNLALQNGIFNGDCKGTAWFCDVKLEKAEMTNSWNYLVVFFKNVDATVSLNGEQIHHKKSLSDALIDEIDTYVLDKFPDTIKSISGNKMSINSIDRYYVDEVLTEKDLVLSADKKGYSIDPSLSPVVSKTLDKHLAQKHYNQIIIFSPLSGISKFWWGLGAMRYRGVDFAQMNDGGGEGSFKNDEFHGAGIVHETTHCLERKSRAINGDKTPSLDNERKIYQEKYGLSPWEWYYQYRTATLPDGRGLDPVVFNASSGKYTLVSDDMTTGKGIEQGSSSVTPPAPKNFKVESVSDENVRISWDTVANASGYQFTTFKSANFKETNQILDCLPNGSGFLLGPIVKGKPVYYGIRTVASVNGTTVCSDWTTLTYTHMGVGIVRGDIDNNGVFNINDIAAAVDCFFSGEKIDKRTADAVGISGRDNINVQDIATLVDWFLNG